MNSSMGNISLYQFFADAPDGEHSARYHVEEPIFLLAVFAQILHKNVLHDFPVLS